MGPQELIVVVLLVLIVFGPAKAAGVARDLGRFVGAARGQAEELKGELAASSGEDREEEEKKSGGVASLGRAGRGRPRRGTGSKRGGAPGGEGMRRAGPAREEAPD